MERTTNGLVGLEERGRPSQTVPKTVPPRSDFPISDQRSGFDFASIVKRDPCHEEG
jgi:hypothetical protein